MFAMSTAHVQRFFRRDQCHVRPQHARRRRSRCVHVVRRAYAGTPHDCYHNRCPSCVTCQPNAVSASLRPPAFRRNADLARWSVRPWVVLPHGPWSDRDVHLGVVNHHDLNPLALVVCSAELLLRGFLVRNPPLRSPCPALENPFRVQKPWKWNSPFIEPLTWRRRIRCLWHRCRGRRGSLSRRQQNRWLWLRKRLRFRAWWWRQLIR